MDVISFCRNFVTVVEDDDDPVDNSAVDVAVELLSTMHASKSIMIIESVSNVMRE
jgi:hypothetical protein